MISLIQLSGTVVIINRAHIVAVYSIKGGCQVVTINGSWSVKSSLKDFIALWEPEAL